VKVIFIIGILAFLVIAGCTTTPESKPPEQKPQPQKNQTCRTVTEEVPVVKEECGEVAYTEQVCSMRKLNYTQKMLPKVDLCISDGVCTGKPLGDCQGCAKAMTRCILQITNLESEKSGTWSVGANYTMGTFGFNKDPISHSIGPNQTSDFDFNQIYTPGFPISSATCTLAVVSEPSAEECIGHTRTTTECRNVTKTESVSKEVCQ
jgi:hypothetical protein